MITLDNPIGLADYIVWFLGLIVISYSLRNRYPWTVSVAVGFTIFSSLRIYQNSLNGVPSNPIIQQFDTAAEGALLSFLLSILIVQALSISLWTKIFKAVAVANAVVICADFLFFAGRGLLQHLTLSEIFHHEPWGILLNASMSGCFNAVAVFLFDKEEKWFRELLVVSILVAGRSLPVAVFFAGLGAWFFVNKKYKALALVVPVAFSVGFLVKGAGLFAPRGRDVIWTEAYYFFRDHLRWSVGSGLGGFYVIGPVLTPKEGVLFTWLHSDWLQILFEEGFVGFLLVVAVYVQALRRARLNPKLFSALVGYGAYGVANMPLRYPLAGLLGAFLMRWALEYNN